MSAVSIIGLVHLSIIFVAIALWSSSLLDWYQAMELLQTTLVAEHSLMSCAQDRANKMNVKTAAEIMAHAIPEIRPSIATFEQNHQSWFHSSDELCHSVTLPDVVGTVAYQKSAVPSPWPNWVGRLSVIHQERE